MFAAGFQYLAFQVSAANNNESTGNGKFSFVYPYQKLISEQEQKEKIKEIKASINQLSLEIDLVDQKLKLKSNDLNEKTILAYELNKELKKVFALMQERKTALMRRLRNEEAILILLIASKRRRLRIA